MNTRPFSGPQTPPAHLNTSRSYGGTISTDLRDDSLPLRTFHQQQHQQPQQHRPSPPVQKHVTISPNPAAIRTHSRANSGASAASAVTSPLVHSRISRTPTSPEEQAHVHVCLCQPEPKIPRPRNAFILYRQHHQASIVARNPGLSNPEISKIVGEQWQVENEAVKEKWRSLAAEEKLRHQAQYPEYRYQPNRGKRRSLSDGATSASAAASDRYRCNKCGGRSIRTPTSAFSLSQLTPSSPSAGFSSPSPSTAQTPVSRFTPLIKNLTLNSPSHPHSGSTTMHPPPRSNGAQLSATRDRFEPEAYGHAPTSPDAKRRRFDSAVYEPPPSARLPPNTPYPFANHPPPGTSLPHQPRRESLPPSGQLLMRRASQIPPLDMMTPRTPRHPSEHLVLPPLQERGDQHRSIEETITKFSTYGKIKCLGKVSPAIKPSAAASQGHDNKTRGAIIAVEGDDVAAITSISNWLHNFLRRAGDFSVRLEEGPTLPEPASSDRSLTEYLIEYHSIIIQWLNKSKEMIEYITSTPPTGPGEGEMSEGSHHERCLDVRPLVIIPRYQVRASDAYALTVPLADTYNALDHWSWMASMWRGTVGADFTIYIKDCTKEEMAREKAVDIMEELKVIIVRKGKDEPVSEVAMRRVGFEAGEWARAIGKAVEHD